VNWHAIALGSETIVVYMGIHNLGYIIKQLTDAGLNPETPVALVRWGTRPEQEELIGNLSTIVDKIAEVGFEAPAIAIIGNVVNLHGILSQCRPQFL
jgi:uroporphyrin-III C-methyltransferase